MRSGSLGLAVAALLLCGAADGTGPTGGTTPDEQEFAQVERGRQLVVLGDCAACHTAAGGQPFAGGRPIQTPFGTILSSNITPDRATGIGSWSNQEFVRLMQHGIAQGGRHIYPAMPYPAYTHVTRDDDLAMRAWLASIPAVRNTVQSNQLPFPFDIRATMIGWNLLFFQPGQFQPDPKRSAEWNRGAYLVTGLEHCGACHTPKNLAGAEQASGRYQGAVIRGWFAPNITDDRRRGLGTWSIDDVVAYLRTGHNRIAAASGPMAEEVGISSSHVSDADLHAMATYLKSLPGQSDASTPLAADDARMRMGAAIYADECSACHAPHGEGVSGLLPTLAGAPSVQSRQPTSLIRVVLEGARSAATDGVPTGPAMPAFGWMLSDTEVAAVVTYIRNAWGNAAAPVDAGAVATRRESLTASARQDG